MYQLMLHVIFFSQSLYSINQRGIRYQRILGEIIRIFKLYVILYFILKFL
jgi:hypothetical protein